MERRWFPLPCHQHSHSEQQQMREREREREREQVRWHIIGRFGRTVHHTGLRKELVYYSMLAPVDRGAGQGAKG